MRAAWYERPGPAHQVLIVGTMPVPWPAPGEVRVKIAVSGVHRRDAVKRHGRRGPGMTFPRVIPHDDGAGVIDAVGRGVDARRLGQRVWIYLAQSYRPFGTAAEYAVVPAVQAVPLPAGVPFDQAAGMGVPGIIAHRAVFEDGPVDGRLVLVTGALCTVGRAAVTMARRGGAVVIATVHGPSRLEAALAAGAHYAVDVSRGGAAARIGAIAPYGVDRVVEGAFGADLAADPEIVAHGGTIAVHSSDRADPAVPYRRLADKNITVHFLGHDDFPDEANRQATADLTAALRDGDLWYPVAARFPLERIAEAHAAAENGSPAGHIVLELDPAGARPDPA
ncbi:NADPH:quinone reductase [Actinomadura sediminis]|uniref:NADPH:quinone reductase n=2 Tax=Actinomadura sediminis TaxID=1038904 RepID=A0ABW3EQU5_9ACTN